jgi:hypothetical protein
VDLDSVVELEADFASHLVQDLDLELWLTFALADDSVEDLLVDDLVVEFVLSQRQVLLDLAFVLPEVYAVCSDLGWRLDWHSGLDWVFDLVALVYFLDLHSDSDEQMLDLDHSLY